MIKHIVPRTDDAGIREDNIGRGRSLIGRIVW